MDGVHLPTEDRSTLVAQLRARGLGTIVMQRLADKMFRGMDRAHVMGVELHDDGGATLLFSVTSTGLSGAHGLAALGDKFESAKEELIEELRAEVERIEGEFFGGRGENLSPQLFNTE